MKRIAFSLLAATAFLTTARAADAYTIDVSHSKVGFSVSHMVISDVEGRFKEFSGMIQVDEQDPAKSSVEVTIKVASIDTENEKRDEHLRSADFFDAPKFPEITFRSVKVEKKGNAYVATGALTIRGVMKTVSIPFTATGPIKDPWGNTRRGFKGSLTLNRQDYGVSWSNKLDGGGLVVGDEVTVSLSVEAVKKQ